MCCQVLPQLLKKCLSPELDMHHGAVVALAHVLHALYQLHTSSSPARFLFLCFFLFWIYFIMSPPNYEWWRLLCSHYVSMFCANVGIFYSLWTNTERISMKFGGGNHYRQQMNLVLFGLKRDEGAGCDIKFDLTSNRCCHAVNDFRDFTVHTACCPQGWRVHYTYMQQWRHHMTACSL